MPSLTQIVPRYKHSYVETYVNDNTKIVEDSTVEVEDLLSTIHVFRSPKGIDNTIVKKTSTKSISDTFGKTDYRKYGQPFMMPFATVESGVASAACMRIMPEDATYANSNLYMYYRTTERTIVAPLYNADGSPQYETDGTTPKTETTKKPVFQVMFRATTDEPELDPVTNRLKVNGTGVAIKSGACDKKTMIVSARKSTTSIPGTDGQAPIPSWNCVYLGTFYSAGRGSYGNEYRWRIALNSEYEKDHGVKLYSFEILSTEGGLSKIASYAGSFGDCVINDTSKNISDIISSYDVGTSPVGIESNVDAITSVYEEYVSFLEELAADGKEVTIPDLDEFDPLFGRYVGSEKTYEYYQVVTSADDIYPLVDDISACAIDNPTGNYLKGGYDGAFSTFIDITTKEKIYGPRVLLTAEEIRKAESEKGITGLTLNESTFEEMLYIEAFNGLLDRKILSSIRVPADYLLDADYPYGAKLAFANFVMGRYDSVGYIDTGLSIERFSTSAFNTLSKKYFGVFTDRALSKNVQGYYVLDRYTRKKVPVTHTYMIALNFPNHVKQFGLQQAFTKSYARLTGFVKDSVFPTLDTYENSLMSQLAEMRFNYIEAIGENVFQRGMQNTAQVDTSDLLEESNMHVLFWLKRHIERDVFDSLYDFSDPADRATFKQVEEAKYEHIIGKMVSSFTIKFDMNSYETQRQILHCYVEVQFRTISKQGIVEIDVNKRSFAETPAA